MYDALIVVNGEIPRLEFWQEIRYRTIICTDGAANTLKDFAITPNIIIGDLDSISVGLSNATVDDVQKHFSATEVFHLSDQQTTDFEKAFHYVLQHKLKKVICLGVLGKSADHTIHNLSVLSRYSKQVEILVLHTFDNTRQWIFPLSQNTRIHTKIGSIISFFPFPEAVLTSQGLKWELTSTLITQQGHAAVRNTVQAENISLHCQQSCLCFLTADAPPAIQHLPSK